MCTSAPPWLNAVRLNEIPNFTGVTPMARVSSLAALNRATSSSRRLRSPVAMTWSHAAAARSGCRTGWP